MGILLYLNPTMAQGAHIPEAKSNDSSTPHAFQASGLSLPLYLPSMLLPSDYLEPCSALLPIGPWRNFSLLHPILSLHSSYHHPLGLGPWALGLFRSWWKAVLTWV